MKTTLTRLFTVALLMMISIAAGAQVKVICGKDGEAMKADEKGTIVIPQKEQKEPLVGGTITITQEKPTDGKVRVNFNVAPASGYSYTDGNITLVAFYPLSSTRADNPAEDITVHSTLTLTPKDKSQTDTSKPRDYYVDIDEGLGLWVQKVSFGQEKEDESKGNRTTGSVVLGRFSGTYYIASNYKTANSNPAVYNYDATTLENNYYLCPTDWEKWCTYKPDDDFFEKNEKSDYPFLTTYQCRKSSYKPGLAYAKWIITKHPTENYYYIKHAADDKYLMLNGQIKTTPNNANGPNRMRVHLEAVTGDPGDNALFSIIEDGSCSADGPSVIFRPKTMSTYQLTINGGNTDALTGQSGKVDGPTGYTDTRGIIGIYGKANDDSKYLYLEDYIKRPAIGYNSEGNVEITYATPAHIYYTIDGSDPTDGTNANRLDFTGTSQIVAFQNSAVIRAAAYIGDEYSNIATFTGIKLGSTNPYLLQSVENTGFYMIAGESATNTPVNTSSLPQAGMSWWFEDADDVTDGVKYYYVHNTSAAGYLRRDNNSFYITATSGTSDDYKFAVMPIYNESGILTCFNLYNKAKKQYVYKNQGNGANNAVNLSTDGTQQQARWNLILVANNVFPSIITPSNNTSTTYYTLSSSNATDYLIVPPSGNAVNVTTSNVESDSQKWYFEDAGDDGWASYYYIRNAVTGEAMYFNKEAVITDQTEALLMKTLPADPTDAYKFALAKTIADNECYIIPKPLAQFAKTNYTALWRENANALQTRTSRASTKIKWQISEIVNYVAPPVIACNLGTGIVTITCTTPGATIHYTKDGSDPTESSPSYSEGGFPLGSASSIKAIAIKGSSSSNITTKTFINGLYYIKHVTNDYRMYPSTTVDGSGNPYVTTKTDKGEDAVWEIRQQGDYYTIKHYKDGKYMWTEDPAVKTNTVHLVTAADTNDDKLLYEFTPDVSLSGVYTIKPKNANNEDGKNFLDTTSGDNGTNTIGLYNTGNGIRWELVTIPMQPVITVNDIDVTITNALGDIVYTTDGSNPVESGTAITVTANSTTTTLNYGKEYTVRAVSRYTDREATPNNHYSAETTETVEVEVEQPVISVSATNKVTISSSQTHNELITIRYNYDEITNTPSDPTTTSGNVWTNSSSITLEDGKAYTIKAIAYTAEGASTVKRLTINLKGALPIQSFSDIDDQAGNYYFADNFNATGSPSNDIGTTVEKAFKGKIDGKMKEISLGSSPLFEYVEDATIKNVIISSASVSTSGHAGAIANVARGETRIYNCGILSGTVSGSDYVGGIVGLLDAYSRVINCYSYASVSGGSDMGGIVGYNNYASKSSDIRTMVMNCMFYGTISGSGNISPVYGGLPIHNLNGDTETGLNTYNYYRYETNKKNITAGKYNNALAAKDQYLTRFELYRQLLNSNRKLAAWYATGDANKGIGENNEMAKWVLDKSKAKYPILKSQDYYPSVVNYDPLKYYTDEGTEVQRSNVTERNKGKILGELTVNISVGGHGSIKEGKSQITLKRIDKDYGNYNFNYDKVQLPYFNEVGDGNYTDGMVVTGWKVTVSGGSNHYTTGADVTYDTNGKATETPYNFADRKCTEKDNYDNSKRVFSQGAYFDVPYGVTSIDIEAYWGKAAYICDKYYDVVYKKDFTSGTNNIDDMGEQENSLLTGGQTIYTAIGDDNNGALASLTGVSKPTVYDYALVLVGNLHLNDVPSNGTKPFTIMSADFDHDNEPDYSLIYTHFGEPSGRKAVSPIRFDFINVPGMAMAQKPENPDADATYFRNVGIFNPKGWFEITNTCNIAFTQFEYDNGGKSAAPVILLGGEFEQFVSTQSSAPTVTQYIHIGGNAWFKEFNNGTHSDGTKFTPHIPISATGGDYDKFYLSGAYKPDADVSADDAEGYISGGRFGEVAGAGQQQIDGNVYWQIYDADITDFYGGGINSDKPITGNITIDIYNSHVTTYCGGPKFGNNNDKVTTNATGCTFTNYYGAGYGGIAYVRKRTQDATSYNFTTWVGQYTTNKGKYFDGTTKIGDNSKGEMAGPGVAVDFDYEFFVWSSGATGGRFYIKYASLSFATTNDVVSILNNCDITESFYGGGRLGKVDGTINSTLNGCRVTGNVFGAGYSAERPKVPYRNGGFESADDIPSIDTNAGVFADGVKSTNIEELELNPGQELKNGISAIGTSGKIDTDFTEDQLKALGTVSGVVTLNINNYTANSNTVQSVITGDVFGGGAMSKTTSNVNVNISGGSVGNVYGGGDEGAVGGNTVVTLSGSTTVNGNVFGGGNQAPVSGSATVNIVEQ